MDRIRVSSEQQERVDVFRRERALLFKDVSARMHPAVCTQLLCDLQAARGSPAMEGRVRVHVSMLTPQQGVGPRRLVRSLLTECNQVR